MRLLATSIALLALLGLALATPEATPRSSTAAETFAVDPVHSSVLFRVKHNGAAYFYGRFNEVAGEFTYDAEEPSNSEVLIEVQADSVDTRNEKLDGHIKSPDFFDAIQFPVVTFASSRVERIDEHRFQVTGELTMHGVSKEIEVEVEHVGTSEGRRGKIMGLHTVFTVNRRDFGMTYGSPEALGDEVQITLSVEAGAR